MEWGTNMIEQIFPTYTCDWTSSKVNISMGIPKIEEVIFNYPATIIIFKDGSKSVVKCTDSDTWDPEKGFYAALLSRILGKAKLHSLYKTFVKPEELKEAKTFLESGSLASAMESIIDSLTSFITPNGFEAKMMNETWEESAKAEKDG